MRRISVVTAVGLAAMLVALPAAAQAAPLSKAQVKRAIERNKVELRELVREKPYLARRRPAVTQRSGGVRAAQSGICTARATFTYSWLVNWNVAMFWNNAATCGLALPVFIIVQSNMISPAGVPDIGSQNGVNVASVAGRNEGRGGTWNFLNSATFSSPVPLQVVAGACVGSGTPVVTCFYNQFIPVPMAPGQPPRPTS